MAWIDIDSLSFAYKGKEDKMIIDNLSVHLGENGLISIIGESGSGKSTLLNILSGYLTDYEGTVSWSCRKERIGVVFQNLYLINHLNVKDNVTLPWIIYGGDKKEGEEKAKDCLNQTGILDLSERKLDEISGGQRARVGLARSLCLESQIILADEPTGSLDSENSKNMMELLKELSRDHLIIVVTHNEKLAMEYSDEVYSLEGGRLVTLLNKRKKANIPSEPNEDDELGHISLRENLRLALSFLKSRLGRIISSLWFSALCFGLIITLFSLSKGAKKEMEGLASDCYDYTLLSLSENRTYEIPGQEMKLIKKVKLSAQKEEALKIIGRTMVFYPSLEYFLPSFGEGKSSSGYLSDSFFYTPCLPSSERLLSGRMPRKYNECVVNQPLLDLGKGKLKLGSVIKMKNDSSLVTDLGDGEVSDVVSLDIGFTIVGISKEKEIISRASLYYSLPLMKDKILRLSLPSLSSVLGRSMDISGWMEKYADDDSSATSFKTLAYCSDPLAFKGQLNDEEINISSYSLEMAASLQEVINSFAEIIVLFILLSLACSFLLELVIIESVYEDKKEELAVYLSFHISKADFFRLGLGQVFIFFASVTCLSAFSFFGIASLGNVLLVKYGLSAFISLDVGLLPWLGLFSLCFLFAYFSGSLPLRRIYNRDLILSLKGE